MTLPLVGSIACPACGVVTAEPVPEDACLFFFECPSCRTMLRPRAGDCCVFCSYGTAPCRSRGSGGSATRSG